jgi:beta-lactamase class A
MKHLGFLLLFLSSTVGLLAQSTDIKLQEQLKHALQGFHGVAGVYVKHLKTGKIAAVNSDTLFPTASMIKIPILIGIMDKLEKGHYHYHQQLEYRDSLLYPGEDILGSFKDGEKIALSKVIMLMLTTSDNTASLWLQSLAGTGTRINELLDSLGLQHTRVNSRTPGREANRQQYGWGQTTPREMVMLMEMIYKGSVISAKASEKMLRLLGRNFYDEQAISQIPAGIFIASKNGAVDASRSETLLVMAPHGPYIFSIITKNQQDTSWTPDNEGWQLARKVSALLWNYFEPRYQASAGRKE